MLERDVGVLFDSCSYYTHTMVEIVDFNLYDVSRMCFVEVKSRKEFDRHCFPAKSIRARFSSLSLIP